MKNFLKKSCFGFLILFLIIIFVIIIILLFRSQQTALRNSNCELPCWQGITVGETTENEVIDEFDDASFIHYRLTPNIVRKYFNSVNIIRFQLYRGILNISTVDGFFYTQNGKVVYLNLGGNFGSLNVEKVIDQFGEPTYVYIKSERPSIINACLFYPEEGLIFEASNILEFDEIKSNTRIYGLTVIKPKDFQAYVENSGMYPVKEPYQSIFVPWSGYGELRGKYWFPGGQDKY